MAHRDERELEVAPQLQISTAEILTERTGLSKKVPPYHFVKIGESHEVKKNTP